MDAIEASTRLYVPPETLYEFIQGYDGVAAYSDHLDRIERDGDGGPGTDYRITFSWWRLSWTSESRVTDTDPPERIDWRSTGSVRARGTWSLEPLEPSAVPDDRTAGTELTLRVEFDPATVTGGAITRTMPVGRLVERVTPVLETECRRVLAAVAADLEGEPREVGYTVHRGPDSF